MEAEAIAGLFQKLCGSQYYEFTQQGLPGDVPTSHGVYVIYDPGGRALHVGRSIRAKRGLRQRLKNHLAGKSSFVRDYLHDRTRLRDGYRFRYVTVYDARHRALLEAYATGHLCPAHIGTGARDAAEADDPATPR